MKHITGKRMTSALLCLCMMAALWIGTPVGAADVMDTADIVIAGDVPDDIPQSDELPQEAEEPVPAPETETERSEEIPEAPRTDYVPQTGDESQLSLWTVIMGISAIAILATAGCYFIFRIGASTNLRKRNRK